MKHTTVTVSTLSSLGLIIGLFGPEAGLAQGQVVEEVRIVGVRDNRTSRGATGLTLDLKSTPQSISVVDREMMENFGASNINDALDLATGLRVERWETNRTNFQARGFEIKNTQIDGVGLPNNWGLVTGAIDSFGYEKLEVIRGANGLLTGVGSASGTINYVRKRPTNTTEGSVTLRAGSFDMLRVEADYSTPLTRDGDWAGRIVLAAEDANSYLRGLSNDRVFGYGVVDGQLTQNSTLALGYSRQNTHSNGNMWGGLVFSNADGTQAEWPRDASTAQDWTYWNTVNETAFVEYNYFLPNDWALSGSYNYRNYEDISELFFASTYVGLEDGLGLTGWPAKWPTKSGAHLLDVNLGGDFSLFGGDHELIVGVSHAESQTLQYFHTADASEPAFGAMPAFPYPGDSVPVPVWSPRGLDSDTEETVTRYYGATRFVFGDLSTILGVNATRFEREGTAIEGTFSESEVSPYVGLMYAVTDIVSVYASYSDIYQPQDFYDITGAYLDPTKGLNYEVGAKANWFDDQLLTTVALFKAEQEGLGTFAGLNQETAQYYYVGNDVFSKGFEIEASGSINDYVNVVVGFTKLQLEDEAGVDTYTWVPRETFNFSVNTYLPQMDNIALGIGGKWQSSISKVDSYTGFDVDQGAFWLLNAYARWEIDAHSHLQFNVNNMTNEKYITSLFEIGFYGAPSNMALSYSYTF